LVAKLGILHEIMKKARRRGDHMAELVAGLPDMCGYHTIGNTMDDTGVPGPMKFLPALLEALTGLQVAPARGFGEAAHGKDAVAWVREGEEQAESGCMDGLGPVRWPGSGFQLAQQRMGRRHLVVRTDVHQLRFTNHPDVVHGMLKSGYVHRVHRGSLAVEFASTQAEVVFHEVWQRVFGEPASLS
jgi:hypothetical protein